MENHFRWTQKETKHRSDVLHNFASLYNNLVVFVSLFGGNFASIYDCLVSILLSAIVYFEFAMVL